LEKIQSSLIAETLDVENNDFIELLMFSKNEGVLMTGQMTDGDQNTVMNYMILYFNTSLPIYKRYVDIVLT